MNCHTAALRSSMCDRQTTTVMSGFAGHVFKAQDLSIADSSDGFSRRYFSASIATVLRPRCCNALGPARLLHPVTICNVSRGLLTMESPLMPDFTEHSSGFIATVLQCETLWGCCAGKCFLLHKCERVMMPHAS